MGAKDNILFSDLCHILKTLEEKFQFLCIESMETNNAGDFVLHLVDQKTMGKMILVINHIDGNSYYMDQYVYNIL